MLALYLKQKQTGYSCYLVTNFSLSVYFPEYFSVTLLIFTCLLGLACKYCLYNCFKHFCLLRIHIFSNNNFLIPYCLILELQFSLGKKKKSFQVSICCVLLQHRFRFYPVQKLKNPSLEKIWTGCGKNWSKLILLCAQFIIFYFPLVIYLNELLICLKSFDVRTNPFLISIAKGVF